jgi:hypothetical protein
VRCFSKKNKHLPVTQEGRSHEKKLVKLEQKHWYATMDTDIACNLLKIKSLHMHIFNG